MMINKVIGLLNKYRELVLYVFFGGLTTLVNFIAFWIIGKILGEEFYLVSNAAAWFIAVVFAYFTNKIFVFESGSFAPKVLLKEMSIFFSARVFSFGVEEIGMWLLVDALNFGGFSVGFWDIEINGQMIAKIVLSLLVIIINYFMSKFVAFRKKEKR